MAHVYVRKTGHEKRAHRRSTGLQIQIIIEIEQIVFEIVVKRALDQKCTAHVDPNVSVGTTYMVTTR